MTYLKYINKSTNEEVFAEDRGELMITISEVSPVRKLICKESFNNEHIVYSGQLSIKDRQFKMKNNLS